ncbi:MAG: PfkB family carbohydrate kinase [Erysipelotrichaceae bacterium]|nr:PfkB family carbohydrate kinase [Erysipelotrichaceae bacterium]
MIYTITTNPALDYYLKINKLTPGRINRTTDEAYDAAGKGVNVSKFLDKLNIGSVALGFLGGFTKDYYLDILSTHKNIQPQFTTVGQSTRINVKIQGEEETSLNTRGPVVNEIEYAKFANRLSQIYDNDYVVLSGNVQSTLVDRISDSIRDLSKEGVKVVLDTDNKVVDKLVDDKLFMIKMTYTDIGTEEADIIAKGKELMAKGVKYFLYSAPNTPSYLFEDGYYLKCNSKHKETYFLTGTSDGMVAGFLWAKLKGANSLEAFTYANAVSTTTSILDETADLNEINEAYNSLEIERVEY